jgi:glycine/serine hydroxymethyltransferase
MKSAQLPLMDVAHIAGLIVGGVQKNPFDFGFDAMTTTTHKTLRGPRGGMILVRVSEELAKKVDKADVPRPAGRSAHEPDCSEGRRIRGSTEAVF